MPDCRGLSHFFLCSAVGVFAVLSSGCSGGASASSGCRTHSYTYVDTGAGGYGGAGWYDGDYSGGWYDPGDEGYDYSDVGDGSGDDGTYYDDGSGDNGSYDDGTGDNGSGDNGGYDDGSGDNGSYDDGSGSGGDGTGDDGSGSDSTGDDGSGDDGSGDDGTASHHHLHLTNASLHTQSAHAGCYAYTCTLVCAVDSGSAREAKGMSSVSQGDACTTAQHGLENWAHDTLHRDIGACKQISNDASSSSGSTSRPPGLRTPASPSVAQGFSSNTPPVPPRFTTRPR